MARTPDPDRIKDAMWHVVSDEGKARHRAELAAALEQASAATRPVVRARRRFSVIAVAAGLLALPAGIAFAAEGALPGDPLYPVKRVTETVRSWVDDDIVAEHRVDELEELLESDASSDRIGEQIQRAEAEVDQLDPAHELQDRLSALATDRVGDELEAAGPLGTTTIPPVTETTTTTTTVSDRTTTTTTRPATTTTSTTQVDRTTTTISDSTTTTAVSDKRTSRVGGRVLAGPTCPVERFPPDPACDDQPVAGAVLVVVDSSGQEVASARSDEAGGFQLRLEPGSYVLVPQPYDGLLGTAAPQEFIAADEPVRLLVAYDTGIR